MGLHPFVRSVILEVVGERQTVGRGWTTGPVPIKQRTRETKKTGGEL